MTAGQGSPRWLALWRPALALLAVAYIVGLSLHGGRQATGVAWFEAKGFLAERESIDIREVVVSHQGTTRTFRRGEREEWLDAAGHVLPADAAAKLDFAVKLLRVTAPERHIEPAEMAGTTPADFGLDRPGLSVSVAGPALPRFSFAFGGLNPLGLSRYLRIDGREGLWLLPKHVSDAWSDVQDLKP